MLFYCLWRNVGTSCRKYFVVVSRHQQTLPLTTLLRKYDVTPLFQDGRREWSILLPVSYLLTSLPLEGQNLRYQRIKFRQHISIHCWDITTSIFEKNVRHFGILLPVSISTVSPPIRRNLHITLHQATEFRPSGSAHCGNMTSYRFFKMAATTAQHYFRFRICWCHCIQKVKVYRQTRFRRHASIHGWDRPTSNVRLKIVGI